MLRWQSNPGYFPRDHPGSAAHDRRERPSRGDPGKPHRHHRAAMLRKPARLSSPAATGLVPVNYWFVTIQAGLVDVPWSRDGFRVRVFPFALKGHAMTAQGNALGAA